MFITRVSVLCACTKQVCEHNHTYRNIGELLCKVIIKFADLYEHWNGFMMCGKSLCCQILGDPFGDFQAVV